MSEQNFDIAIVGGGASGLISAIKSASKGCRVVLIEKGYMCGRKVMITGKGRCNITNNREWEDFLHHVHPNNQWFKSAFYHFSNRETVSFFESIGLPVVEERGDRIFPQSGRAQDVANVLVKKAKALGVEIVYGAEASVIRKNGELFLTEGVISQDITKKTSGGVRLSNFAVSSKCVIIATGGLSYPQTGSTGDGYKFAESFGHNITNCLPSLTALKPSIYHHDLIGILLKNVGLDLYIDDSLSQSEFGELQFTSGGVEGALGFRLSRKAVRALENGSKVELFLDLKPAVSLQEFSERVKKDIRDMKDGGSRRGIDLNAMNSVHVFNRLLNKYMPSALITPFIEMNNDLNVNNIASRLKRWRFEIVSYVGYERCVITSGGVSLKEVSRKNMESKIVPGLFFAGEVLDLDGDTGGYNLQIAFSTGALAGDSAAEKAKTIT